MERFDLVPACQIPSRSTASPIHMHTASKQPGTIQEPTKPMEREDTRGERARERERKEKINGREKDESARAEYD